MAEKILPALWSLVSIAILPVFTPIWSLHMAFALIASVLHRLRFASAPWSQCSHQGNAPHQTGAVTTVSKPSGPLPPRHPQAITTNGAASAARSESVETPVRTCTRPAASAERPSQMPLHFPGNALPAKGRVRCVRSATGRMVLSGRMADVCAELERMAAYETRALHPS